MKPTTILTFLGREVDLEEPEAEVRKICITDVAHALASTCRFGGHCRRSYSVAEHSLLAEKIGLVELGVVEPVVRLVLLLHDAQEAYLGDVVRPLKGLLPEYQVLEERWAAVVRRRFELPWDDEVRALVKAADQRALEVEMGYFWRGVAPALQVGDFVGLAPEEANLLFHEKFQELCEAAGRTSW